MRGNTGEVFLSSSSSGRRNVAPTLPELAPILAVSFQLVDYYELITNGYLVAEASPGRSLSLSG